MIPQQPLSLWQIGTMFLLWEFGTCSFVLFFVYYIKLYYSRNIKIQLS